MGKPQEEKRFLSEKFEKRCKVSHQAAKLMSCEGQRRRSKLRRWNPGRGARHDDRPVVFCRRDVQKLYLTNTVAKKRRKICKAFPFACCLWQVLRLGRNLLPILWAASQLIVSNYVFHRKCVFFWEDLPILSDFFVFCFFDVRVLKKPGCNRLCSRNFFLRPEHRRLDSFLAARGPRCSP
jgi:hypothetical protein